MRIVGKHGQFEDRGVARPGQEVLGARWAILPSLPSKRASGRGC